GAGVVPDLRLEGLGQGGDPGRIDLGNQDDHVAVLGGISAVRAHDAEYLCRTRLGEIDRLDDVGADVALGVAAADRIDQNCILVAEMTDDWCRAMLQRPYPTPRHWCGR